MIVSAKSMQNLKKNKAFYGSLFALPYWASQSIDEIAKDAPAYCRPLVGGQAVMGGVMMRNGDVYGLAVRKQDAIVACKRPWVSILNYRALRLPFIRGFPVLLETLYNGVQALNHSAILSEDASEPPLTKWQLILNMIIAIILAIVLFVLAPHLLSILMYWFDISGDVEGLSFHIWDGFFKFFIFIGYIWLIARIPEIEAVLAYHGAEHKTIHAFELAQEVNAHTAHAMSRLHPRCGTTFLLFVISMSIILHALLVPLLLNCCMPNAELTKHILSVSIKLFLIIPISAVSYEIIRKAAKLKAGWQATLLQAPGLFLQKLTTREPNLAQLEVAVIALYLALDTEDRQKISTVPFSEIDAA